MSYYKTFEPLLKFLCLNTYNVHVHVHSEKPYTMYMNIFVFPEVLLCVVQVLTCAVNVNKKLPYSTIITQ